MADEEKIHQYLTFLIEDEIYALGVSHVKEVLDFSKLASIPRTPSFMRGIINLRGSVIPVMDIKEKFGLGKIDTTDETSIVVTELEIDGDKILLGILTDAVREVISIFPEQIDPAPNVGNSVDVKFIYGMGKVDDHVILILNADFLITVEDMVYESVADDNLA